jgi:hypothetical protein
MRILEKFKCSKCGLEFGRGKFKAHLLRKLPCHIQSSLNFIISSYERLLDKFENVDLQNLKPDEKIYFKNRINDLQLFHSNLSEDEKKISLEFYEENLKVFVDAFMEDLK